MPLASFSGLLPPLIVPPAKRPFLGIAVVLTILFLAAGDCAVYAQTFRVLYTFKYDTDGGNVNGGLLPDSAGNLYGVAEVGGNLSCKYGTTGWLGCGVVFKVTPSGEETVLYSFQGGSDGAGPAATLIRDAAGNFYGTTTAGGDPGCSFGGGSGCGTIFKLDANGHETVLYRFHNGNDGAAPAGALYRDKTGNLWGTAQFGGNIDSQCPVTRCGSVFRLDNAAHFQSHPLVRATEGSWPMGNLIADPLGNIFGTAYFDGPNLGGTVFRLNPMGGGLEVVHAFDTNADGSGPTGLLYSDGKLWGPTTAGGDGGGTVWSLNRKSFDVLFNYFNPTDRSIFMIGTVARDPQGNLFGTVEFEGDQGTIYQLAPDGTRTILHYFEGADGQNPTSGLIRDAQGNLFGTTSVASTVFKLIP
jgi:uncharacterized repeat protein (TIGR03803 family)